MINKDQKIVLLCSNYAWTILNFRLPLIRRLKADGYKVVVKTQFDGYEHMLSKEVDQVESLFISRKGINPFVDIFTILDFLKSLMIIKPDILLSFTIKPVIYSSIAARLMKIPSIVMITGLGTAFIADTWLQKVVKILYQFALPSVPVVFFQNTNDKDLFLFHGLVKREVCRLTPGSGIDLGMFKYSKLPINPNNTFLFVGRMLWDKGIGEFVDAARTIKLSYPNVRFQLLGPLGVENRTSILGSQIHKWEDEGIIEYLGETDNVADYIKRTCCVVLPSYREGTSRVLLEAAAIGRPIIAADVPGCREVVEDGLTGFLCKPRDYLDLSYKIEKMLLLPYSTRRIMGQKGRQKVELEFNQIIVCNLYADAIEDCVKENIGEAASK